MTLIDTPTPKRHGQLSEIRVGLVCAGLLLAIPFGAKLAARYGWAIAPDFSERALMVILAAFIVRTGNAIPKLITARTCPDVDPARLLAFHRFAGWTWVLTGFAFGLASLLLPGPAARTATLVLGPTGIALIAYRWIGLLAARRPAA